MTVPIPHSNKILVRLWIWRWRLRRWLHGFRRNPDCNERRRYRDDIFGVGGTHTHVCSIGATEFVRVPFQPFRFDGEVSNPEDLLYLRINHVNRSE